MPERSHPFDAGDARRSISTGVAESDDTDTRDGTSETAPVTAPVASPPATTDCSAETAAVGELKQRFNEVAAQVNETAGEAVWPLLCQLGDVRRRLAEAQQALTTCLASATSAPTPAGEAVGAPLVTGTLLTLAGCAKTTPARQQATLWDLTDPTAGAETVGITNGQFAFEHDLATQAAITVATIGEADVTGLDFRSAPLAGPATAPLQLEVVLGPTVSLTVAELNTALAALTPIIPASVQGPGIDVIPTIASLGVELVPGVVSVLAGGGITGSVLGVPLAGIAFSARAELRLAPATTPDCAQIVDVELIKPVELQFPGSLMGTLASALVPFVEPLLATIAMGQLRDELRRRIPAALADALAVAALPATCTLTLRSATVSADAITFQPAIGCVGDALSVYDPPPIAAV